MKTAFVFDGMPLCGGIKVAFEYVSRMKDAYIVANTGNPTLEEFYGVKVMPMAFLFEMKPEDAIIMCWWMQADILEGYEGRKIQFVQGNDILGYNPAMTESCLAVRKRTNWEVLATSEYAGAWTGRDFTVIPNGIPDSFLQKEPGQRDIDILIEGRYEPNKRIDEAIVLAKTTLAKKVAWLGVDAFALGGVEPIVNPPQEDLPGIYKRAKSFVKLSESEGFCLPALEAMAAGCLVITKDMGGNDFCTKENSILDNQTDHLDAFLGGEDYSAIIQKGRETAQSMTWDKSVEKLEKYLHKI